MSTTPPVGGGPAVTCGWDQARRMASAGPPGSVSTYAYDGDGLRASKTVGGSATAFAWDLSGGLPLAVRDGSLSVVYGPGGLPLEQVAADGTAQWFFHDQLGSTRALTDSTGAVAGAWSYDPYGAVVSSSGTATTHFGFAGEYTDAETGFVYLRARYYDPSTGQFLSRDRLVAETRSAYGYVAGSPLNIRDPSGLDPAYTGTSDPSKSYGGNSSNVASGEVVQLDRTIKYSMHSKFFGGGEATFTWGQKGLPGGIVSYVSVSGTYGLAGYGGSFSVTIYCSDGSIHDDVAQGGGAVTYSNDMQLSTPGQLDHIVIKYNPPYGAGPHDYEYFLTPKDNEVYTYDTYN